MGYDVFGPSGPGNRTVFFVGPLQLHLVIEVCGIVTYTRHLCARFKVIKNYGMVHIRFFIFCILLVQTLTINA